VETAWLLQNTFNPSPLFNYLLPNSVTMLDKNFQIKMLKHKIISLFHCNSFVDNSVFLTALQPLWALVAFQSPDLFIIGRPLWTSDQLVVRPLVNTGTGQHKHRINAYTHQTSLP
jgi:hypothetical protein